MNKKLEETIQDIKCLKFLLNGEVKEQYEKPLEILLNYIENSISKETIKEKIEEYDNMLNSCNKFSDINRIKGINERILELKELLEMK